MAKGVPTSTVRGVVLALLAALLLAFGLSAIVAQTASAQGSGSALCDRYPELPECVDDDDDGDDDDQGDDDGGPGGPSADSGSGGNLPFTGYPLGSLIFLLLLLLVAGLTLRAYVAVRDRIADKSSAAP